MRRAALLLVLSSAPCLVLAQWGASGGAADLNHDGVVNGGDLGVLLGLWGPCN